METLKQSLSSIEYFIILVFSWSLHTSKRHLWSKFTISDNKTYAVFRETISDKEYGEKEVTLVIGFRLKLIDDNRLFHWFFQRLCVFDTPIWVGFNGFKTKYWMVEPQTKDYLGLYRYQGKENAKKYAEYICAILRPVSIHNSVWYKIEDMAFTKYTKNHKSHVSVQAI